MNSKTFKFLKLGLFAPFDREYFRNLRGIPSISYRNITTQWIRGRRKISFFLRISFKKHQKHKQQLPQKETSLLADWSLLFANRYNVTTPSPKNKSLPIFILCKGLLWKVAVESGLQNYRYHTGNIASTDGRRQRHIHNTIYGWQVV